MDAYRLNNNSLTVEAGLSVGLIGRARKERKGLHSDTILKILNAMPEVSPEWFLMGTGPETRSGMPLSLLRADATRRKLVRLSEPQVSKAAEPAASYGLSARLQEFEARLAALEKKQDR